MNKNLKKIIQTGTLGVAILTCSANEIQASTIPKPDLKSNDISLGTGPSLSTDIKITPQLNIGGSFSLPLRFAFVKPEFFGVFQYDLRSSYLLYERNSLTITAIGGIWGNGNLFGTFGKDKDIKGNSKVAEPLAPVGIELGFGITYQFTIDLALRINIVPGFSFSQNSELARGLFPPAAGIELGYRLRPGIEGTVGLNGNGDIIGLHITI